METKALACLHEAMEGLIVAVMEEMNSVAIHACDHYAKGPALVS